MVNPAEKRAMTPATSRRNEKMLQDNVFYWTIDLINASAHVVEIGKNVMLDGGDPLESRNNNEMGHTTAWTS